jgi:hypothetical protein
MKLLHRVSKPSTMERLMHNRLPNTSITSPSHGTSNPLTVDHALEMRQMPSHDRKKAFILVAVVVGLVGIITISWIISYSVHLSTQAIAEYQAAE